MATDGSAGRAAHVRAAHRRPALRLDCDAPDGNGTDDIPHRMPRAESRRVEHFTRGSPGDGHREAPSDFLARLPELLEAWKHDGVGLVLFQAGADPHIADPLGSGFLSDDEPRARDALVFETCRRLGLPVAWNLAGGYQEDDDELPGTAESFRAVLGVHDATMEECVRAYVG